MPYWCPPPNAASHQDMSEHFRFLSSLVGYIDNRAHRGQVPPYLTDEHLPARSHEHVLIAGFRCPPTHLCFNPHCILDRHKDNTDACRSNLLCSFPGLPSVRGSAICKDNHPLHPSRCSAHLEQVLC